MHRGAWWVTVHGITESDMTEGLNNNNPLQYSCLENSMHRGAWWATVHRVTESQTQLSDLAEHNLSMIARNESI